ncbi:MAG TPA: argininosuccinate lyase [Bacteroidales bacterium]|jgi:argininosuccinate lyase|nr:argininosuccinate lyase [Bacteroidales bacterium]HNR41234.1 argininosuccinate lyase [Bacteroidales bacterium]HQG77027.1 argininosuccinate lyase [Bacteroidales bacterium]
MKLWEKGTVTENSVIEFTSGSDRVTDLLLAEWDIAGSMAHAIMLEKCGLLSPGEKTDLLNALYSLFQKHGKGALTIGKGVEDIHSQIEKELTDMLGPAGKKIHTGRSRNDQVLTDVRLYTRAAIDDLAREVARLFHKLQDLGVRHKEVLIPGYTHMQPAMLSSFGLWFGSWAEALADDIVMLGAARTLNNRNPLGTAAGYGSTLPLQRRITTELLEFDTLLFNSAYAGLSRGKAELATASSIASIAQTIGRLAGEICLFMSAEFRFVDFPDELITGSSIMPQKRNPDVFELVRGRCNLLQSLPSRVCALTFNLPSGYNREYQLFKQLMFDAFSELRECIGIMVLMLGHIRLRDNIAEDSLYNSIYSTEEVNRLVREGIPFRDAYRSVADSVKKGIFKRTALTDYTHEGTVGNLCNEEIRDLFEKRLEGFRSKSAWELVEKFMKY